MTDEKVYTLEELAGQLNDAIAKGEYANVSKIARSIAKLQATKDKAEAEAKTNAVMAICETAKKKIDGLIQKLIDSGDLANEAVDGVWYSNDFGETHSSCRLLRKAARTSTGGGGGKKFEDKTSDLLAKFGDQPMKEGEAETCQEAYDASTDGNSRYRVRRRLLKLAGVTS